MVSKMGLEAKNKTKNAQWQQVNSKYKLIVDTSYTAKRTFPWTTSGDIKIKNTFYVNGNDIHEVRSYPTIVFKYSRPLSVVMEVKDQKPARDREIKVETEVSSIILFKVIKDTYTSTITVPAPR